MRIYPIATVLICWIAILPLSTFAQNLSNTYPKSIYTDAQILDMGNEFTPLQEVLRNENSLKFNPLSNPNSNLGFTNHHFWVKFSLNNDQNFPVNLFLETGRPITDVADLYYETSPGEFEVIKNGDMMAFENRPSRHRKLIFPITLAANSQTRFFLHLHSDGEVINLPLTLYDGDSLIQSTFNDQLVFGIFYGILLLAGLTYLFFYFGIKERSFILYVAYVFSVAMLHASLDGYFFKYVWKEPSWFADRSVLLFAAISALLFGRYTQVYIRVREYSKGLNMSINAMVGSMILLSVAILFLDAGRTFYYPFVNAIAFIGILLCILGVILSYIKKHPVDPFFALGIASLTIGFITFILNNFSLIENSFITENSAKLGTGLEILFLSLSMANRIRILRTDKEKAQEVALQRSEESNEIKSFFLSNVSHELRTPLNAILGLSQSIMNEIQDDKIKNNLEMIRYSSVSLLSSIEDILDYSKIEKGELNLERKPFDFQKIIQQVKVLTYQQARDKGLTFSYEEKVSLPQKVIGDAPRLRQILMNVIQNAIKFTPEGEVKLIVDECIEVEKEVKIGFKIQDTGVGIKPEKLDRIFESFIQEQIDDKRKFGGFGLGLCIVKALTSLYRGSVKIESEEGKGTLVRIQITFEKAEKDQVEIIQSHKEELLNGKHILVIEDNPVNQLVIKSILRKWKGISFDFANHGLEGLEKLNTRNTDLILMDLQMPEMDGYEATEAIRAGKAGNHHMSIPIIAVTADTMEKSKVRAIAVGMDDYMTKPVDSDVLLEKVLQAFYLEKVEIKYP
ncbi:hybrid sensor histidine kinase/response regulator [Algoriphagus sp. CAU 1675]|uniref:hybrid sensor histidine kinase/response regulator n=1 Tax=Algoriphagus sp. CAU 1675 TaxID=3032597 RepID=UPI0023DA39E6|nr:hybrid sensor histidine kinase/response regulator [Algoriphagus sp. CAU 1675]MDF2157710.1 7TM diverse intracellular signaling domain-containing protein [Algoriphagus sp. CAU 1675]